MIPEPTADQCSARAKVFEDDVTVGYAVWYPQMGGYVGKAVALFCREWREDPNTGSRMGGCIDVLVWHDGEFPFGGEGEDGRAPVRLHHCSPEGFVEFGEFLDEINTRGRVVRPLFDEEAP